MIVVTGQHEIFFFCFPEFNSVNQHVFNSSFFYLKKRKPKKEVCLNTDNRILTIGHLKYVCDDKTWVILCSTVYSSSTESVLSTLYYVHYRYNVSGTTVY